MKLLKRNLTPFEYRAYLKNEEILENGRHTGRPKITYAEPVQMEGNVSVPAGFVPEQWFGIVRDYTHILLMEDPNADLREDGLITWQGNEYTILAVKPSLNVMAVALKRVDPKKGVE